MAIAGLAAACLLAGCSQLPRRKVPLDAASGFYADAALTYRLDAGKLGQPLDVVKVEGQRVSYEQVASSPLVGESIGTLSIVYPHPAGRPGVALARFTLDSAMPHDATRSAAKKSINPFRKKRAGLQAPRAVTSAQPEVHEAWELDIASSESDQLFKTLTNVGYYTSERPNGAAQVAVKLNGREQSKDWDQIPVLNQLIQRVRAQGRLVAYSRPVGVAGSSVGTIASTADYQKLFAAQGTPGTDPAANAFAIAPPPVVTPMPYPPPGYAPPISPPGIPPSGPAKAAGLAQRPAGVSR